MVKLLWVWYMCVRGGREGGSRTYKPADSELDLTLGRQTDICSSLTLHRLLKIGFSHHTRITIRFPSCKS